LTEDRPYLQIPAPGSEYDRRLYEEWLRIKEEEAEEEDNNDRGVIVIDI